MPTELNICAKLIEKVPLLIQNQVFFLSPTKVGPPLHSNI